MKRSTSTHSLTRKIAAMLAATGAFTPVVSHAVDGNWTFQSATPTTAWAGSWALATNWAGATIADGVDAIANFNGLDLQAGVTINLDGTRTIGTLNIGDSAPATAFGYTFQGYGNSGRLIFDVASGSANINLVSGAANPAIAPVFNVPLVLNDNTNLNLNSGVAVANAVTINGNISGAGILNVVGAGLPGTPSAAQSVTLAGINTNAGFTIAGTRVVASAFALGVDNTTTATTLNGGQIYAAGGGAYKGNIVLGGLGFSESGQGQLGALRTDSGNNFFYGSITVNAAAGTARIAGNAGAGAVQGTIYGGIGETGGVGSVDFGRWANSGAGMLGTTVLASSTGYTGKTYISSGTLALGQNNTVGDINSSSDVVFGFDNKPNNASFTQTASSATLQFNRADNITFTKTITQTTSTDTVAVLMTGNVTHSGLGNVTFDNGTSGYTGTTTVNSTGGKLTFGKGGAYAFSGLGAITLSNGGDLEFNTSSAVQIGGGGTVGTTTLPVAQTVAGAAGSYLIQSGSGNLILSGSSDNGGNRVIVNSGTVTFNKHTTVTSRAIGSNNLQGLGVILNGGSIVYGADAHGDQIYLESDVQVNGGTFDLNGKSDSFDVLTGAGGTVTNAGSGASTLSLGENNSNINVGNATIQNNPLWNGAPVYLSNYGGVITNGANSLAVTKIGTGLQTLSGANTYTGATTVSAGTLSVTGSTLTTGAVAVGGGILSGTGSVGDVTLAVTAGSTIAPGATSLANSTGTLTAKSLVVNGGTLAFQLGATPAGTNDKIAVTTTANFAAASTVTTSFIAPPTAGTYTLLTTAVSGLTGTLPTYVAPANTRYTSFTLDPLNTTPDAMTLTIAGSNAITTWTGGTSNTLDFATNGNFTDGGVINNFRNFDVVTFGDGPSNRAPNIATGVGIEAPLTFTNTVGNDYSINVTGTGKLTGLTSITKSGNGVLTINGAHDFFGDVNVTAGTVVANNGAAFGSALGQTFVSNGGTVNVNGQNLGNEIFNIAGAGVGGNGALINNGGDQQNSLRFVKLTDNATVGSTRLDGGGRFDIRDATAGGYTGFLDGVGEGLDLNGKTLTKEGMNMFSVVNANMTNGTVNVNRGTVNIEGNTPVRTGTTLNVNTYGTLLYFNPSQNLNPGQTAFQQGAVNLNGGTFAQTSGSNTVASSAFTVSSLGFLNLTGTNTVLNGGISGGGVLVKQGGGILTLNTANAGFTGSLYHLAGNIDIGDGLLLGSVANGLSANGGGFGSASATILNGATLRYNQGTNVTLPSNINLLNGTFRYEAPMHTNTLTINSALGTDLINSTFTQIKGAVNIGAGADIKVGSFLLAGNALASGNPAITNMSGGTVTATSLNMGENLSGNGTAVLNLSGGRINVMGSDTTADGSFRVGHWPGAQTQLEMTGGTINVPYATMGVGSDTAQPVFNVKGGTVFVRQLNVDARTGANTSNTLDISSGEVMIGVGGLTRTGSLGVVNYRGGKVSFWGNNTSSANIGVEGQREFDTNGFGVTISGNIQGPGGITKTDNGVLVLSGTNNFRGPINVDTGVLRFGSVNAAGANGTVNVASGATFDTGGQTSTAALPSVRPTINVQGSGVLGQAAIWSNVAGTGNTAVYQQLNFTGDTTIGGLGRGVDLANSGINANGYTFTKVGNNELAYSPTSATNMGNFVVESGFLTVQSTGSMGTTGTVTVNPGGELRSWGAVTNAKPVVLNGGVLASGGGGALVADWTAGVSLTANSSIGRIAQGGYNLETDRVIRLTGNVNLNNNTLTKLTRTGLIIANSTAVSDGNMVLYGGTNTLNTNTNMNGGGTVRVGTDASLVLDDSTGAVTMAKTLRLAGGLLNNLNGNHQLSNGLDISGHGRFAAAAGTTLTLDDMNVPLRGGVTFDTTGTITPTFINGLTPSGRLGAGYTAGSGANGTTFAQIVAGNVAPITPTLDTTGLALSTALATDDVLNTTAANAVIASDLTIRTLTSQANVTVNSGALLRIGDGGVVLRTANHHLFTAAGPIGRITSGEASGELNITAPSSFETLGDTSVRLQIVDNPLAAGGFQPVTLVKSGPGQLGKLGSTDLGAANSAISNTFSGGVVVNSGRVTLENGSGFGLGNVTVRDGGTILAARVGTLNQGFVNNLTLAGIGNGEAAGILGALRLVNGETSTGTVTLASRTRIITDTLGNVAGKVVGSSGAALEKTGGGALFLANTANTYTGATEIGTRDLTGGVLAVSKLANGGTASSIGSAAATADKLILDGGTLRYVGAGDSSNKLFTVGINSAAIDARGFGGLNLTANGALAIAPGTSRNLTLSGDVDTTLNNVVNGALPNNTLAATFGDPTHGFTNLVKGGNSIWTLTGNLTGNGTVTVQNGQLRVGNGGTTGSLTGGATPNAAYGIGNVTLQNQADLIFNRSDDIVVKNQITGTDARSEIVQAGAGKLTLGGIYDNTGVALRVDNGTLELAKEVVSGGLLNSGRATSVGNQTTGSNAGVIVNAGTLRLAGAANADDQIGNGVEVLMRGGTFDTNGHSEIIGRLEGNAGTVSGGGNLEIGGYTSNTGSYIGFGGTFDTTAITKSGSNSALLRGNSTTNGAVTINQGRLVLGYNGTTGSVGNSIAVNANGILTVNRSDSATFANAVSGAGAIENIGSGSGTFTGLSGVVTNQFAVRRGTLAVGLTGANTSAQILGNVVLDGGRLALIGNATGTSTFRIDSNSTAMNGGNIRVDGNGGAGTELILLSTNGSVSRGTGGSTGTVNFEAVNGGAIRTNIVNNASGFISTANHAYATYNGNDWAAQVGNSTMGAFTAYANNTYTAGTHTNVTADNAFAAATTTDTIRFATAAATNLGLDAQTLSLGRGGVLVGPAVGANITTVSNGTLAPLTTGPVDSRGADIIIHQNNTAAETVISAVIGNAANQTLAVTTTAATQLVTTTSTAGLYVGMPVSGNANIGGTGVITAVNSATTFTVSNATAGIVAATSINTTLGGANGLVKAGDGVLRLTGNNTFGGAIHINGGKLIIGDGTTNGAIQVPVANIVNPLVNDAVLAWQRSDAVTYGNVIAGFGEVRQEGTGALNLNAANTFAGGLTVSKGSVITNNAAGFGQGLGGLPGLVTLGDADTGANNIGLFVNHSAALTVPNHITVSALGSGTATIGSNNNAASINAIFTGTVNLNRATILGGNLDRTTFAGPITGNVGTLTIANTSGGASGRVTMEAENTFTGNVVINDTAVLQVGSGSYSDARNQLPDNADVTLNGVALTAFQLNGDNETIGTLNSNNPLAEVRTIAGGPSVLTVTNGGTYNGKVMGGSAATAFILESTGGTLTLGGTTDNNAGSVLVNGGNVILNKTVAAMRAVGNLLTINTGVAQLSGTNGDQIFDSATVILNGGSFDLNGKTETIGALNGLGGSVTNTNATASTLTVGGNNTNSTGFFGAISDGAGTIALVKTGAGNLTLASDNSFSGGTTISGGDLQVGAGGASGSLGSGPIVNNGVLAINRTGALSIAGAISGSGSLILNGTATVDLTGNSSTFTGPIAVNAGTLLANNNLGTGNVTVAAPATLGGSGTVGDVAVSGTISPGNSPGTLNTGDLNLLGGSTAVFDLDSLASYDKLNITGSFNIGTGVTAVFNSSITSAGPTDFFFLGINDGVDAISGTFAGLAEGSMVNVNGVDFMVTYFADSTANADFGGNDFALVPEPGSAALLLGGLAMLAGRRRRRA